METSSNALGALWVNKAKSKHGPELTGEIDGKRVAVFKNHKWSENEEKQPLYNVLVSIPKAKKESQKTTE